MGNFEILAEEEMLDIDGGIFGVDDAIFWGLVGTGFAAGIATGISRKNRKQYYRYSRFYMLQLKYLKNNELFSKWLWFILGEDY